MRDKSNFITWSWRVEPMCPHASLWGDLHLKIIVTLAAPLPLLLRAAGLSSGQGSSPHGMLMWREHTVCSQVHTEGGACSKLVTHVQHKTLLIHCSQWLGSAIWSSKSPRRALSGNWHLLNWKNCFFEKKMHVKYGRQICTPCRLCQAAIPEEGRRVLGSHWLIKSCPLWNCLCQSGAI